MRYEQSEISFRYVYRHTMSHITAKSAWYERMVNMELILFERNARLIILLRSHTPILFQRQMQFDMATSHQIVRR